MKTDFVNYEQEKKKLTDTLEWYKYQAHIIGLLIRGAQEKNLLGKRITQRIVNSLQESTGLEVSLYKEPWVKGQHRYSFTVYKKGAWDKKIQFSFSGEQNEDFQLEHLTGHGYYHGEEADSKIKEVEAKLKSLRFWVDAHNEKIADLKRFEQICPHKF